MSELSHFEMLVMHREGLSSGQIFKIIELSGFNYQLVEECLNDLSTSHKFKCIGGLSEKFFINKAREKLIKKIIKSINWRSITFDERIKAITQGNHNRQLVKKICSHNWNRYSYRKLFKAIKDSDYDLIFMLSVFETGQIWPTNRILLWEEHIELAKTKKAISNTSAEEVAKTFLKTNNWSKMSLAERCMFIPITKRKPQIVKAVIEATDWDNLPITEMIEAIEKSQKDDSICRMVRRTLEARTDFPVAV